MERIALMPTTFSRSIAPEALPQDTARNLQNADTTTRPGRLIRKKGTAASQVTASANTLIACSTWATQNGKKLLIDCAAGTVRGTPGDGTKAGGGPLPEWIDTAESET